MTLAASGEISLLDIAGEHGGSTPHAMSEYYGAAVGVPTSSTISASDFHGTTKTSYIQPSPPTTSPWLLDPGNGSSVTMTISGGYLRLYAVYGPSGYPGGEVNGQYRDLPVLPAGTRYTMTFDIDSGIGGAVFVSMREFYTAGGYGFIGGQSSYSGVTNGNVHTGLISAGVNAVWIIFGQVYLNGAAEAKIRNVVVTHPPA